MRRQWQTLAIVLVVGLARCAPAGPSATSSAPSARVPYPQATAIQTVIDQRAVDTPEARRLTPAQVSEDRFLRELEASGFAHRAYE